MVIYRNILYLILGEWQLFNLHNVLKMVTLEENENVLRNFKNLQFKFVLLYKILSMKSQVVYKLSAYFDFSFRRNLLFFLLNCFVK